MPSQLCTTVFAKKTIENRRACRYVKRRSLNGFRIVSQYRCRGFAPDSYQAQFTGDVLENGGERFVEGPGGRYRPTERGGQPIAERGCHVRHLHHAKFRYE